MNKLLFGTAGIPLSTKKRTTINGIFEVRKLGLDAMELEFVRRVNISESKAPTVKKVAEKNNIVLTCHGQYYINLNSKEQHKIGASIDRVLNAANIANSCGAYSVCFHPAFYMKMDQKKVYFNVKKQLNIIVERLESLGNKIWIRPETTGKKTQFGTLDELLDLSSEINQVMPTVDFAHLHARSGGAFNSYDEFSSVFEKIEDKLGKVGLKNMHIHFAGINYSEKGEKNHLNFSESDFNYSELVQAFRDFKIAGVAISESPNIEVDSLKMQSKYI